MGVSMINVQCKEVVVVVVAAAEASFAKDIALDQRLGVLVADVIRSTGGMENHWTIRFLINGRSLE